MYNILELRNYEVRELYYIVYSIWKKRGSGHREAKAAAYEAVSLRYGISEKRTVNILKESCKLSPEERENFRMQFYERTTTLMELIKCVLHDEFGG